MTQRSAGKGSRPADHPTRRTSSLRREETGCLDSHGRSRNAREQSPRVATETRRLVKLLDRLARWPHGTAGDRPRDQAGHVRSSPAPAACSPSYSIRHAKLTGERRRRGPLRSRHRHRQPRRHAARAGCEWGLAHPTGRRRRLAALHGARAVGLVDRRRQTRRHLLARGPRLRGAHRPPAVRRRDPRRHGARARDRRRPPRRRRSPRGAMPFRTRVAKRPADRLHTTLELGSLSQRRGRRRRRGAPGARTTCASLVAEDHSRSPSGRGARGARSRGRRATPCSTGPARRSLAGALASPPQPVGTARMSGSREGAAPLRRQRRRADENARHSATLSPHARDPMATVPEGPLLTGPRIASPLRGEEGRDRAISELTAALSRAIVPEWSSTSLSPQRRGIEMWMGVRAPRRASGRMVASARRVESSTGRHPGGLAVAIVQGRPTPSPPEPFLLDGAVATGPVSPPARLRAGRDVGVVRGTARERDGGERGASAGSTRSTVTTSRSSSGRERETRTLTAFAHAAHRGVGRRARARLISASGRAPAAPRGWTR